MRKSHRTQAGTAQLSKTTETFFSGKIIRRTGHQEQHLKTRDNKKPSHIVK